MQRQETNVNGKLCFLPAAILAGLICACSASAGSTCGTGACTRVLFLGNSFTYVNDLPSTFAHLAESAGRPVQVAMVANSSETLAQHAASSDSLDKIASQGWSYVVLQEQSETPATDIGRDDYTYPAAETLADRAEAVGAVPLLFMTWAHKGGLPASGLPTYEAMQQQINAAYLDIAEELNVPVAPVGFTWYMVRLDHPDINLWQDDGSHPNRAGTYLAACVFYASIFRESPEGLSFHGGISGEQARAIQAEAGNIVLNAQKQWGLR
ncbi:MAG: SGNH/GDSL hydrolase family protein [Dehalococcoidia bacterium]